MLENHHEHNDQSFIGWPDIVTLEDAANMLRNLNSAFESGEFGNEDDFSWSLFPYNEELDGPSQVINTNSTVNESNYSSSVSATTKVQMSNHMEQTEIHNQSEGNMKDHYLGNYDSYNDVDIGSHSFGYLQTGTLFSQSGTKSHTDDFSTDCYRVAPKDSSLDMLCNPNCEPETSSLGTQLEATTLEESRLNQLQQVMDQLDRRTKLCLRDGLYRLARSAEHRHFSSADGQTEGAEERNEMMDIEIETNPIDRSIAHLLFHRSSDPSANSACDGSSLKSHAMVGGF